MEKAYDIYYVIKEGGKEHLHVLEGIIADNQRVAIRFCKEHVFRMTGRNAFRPTANVTEDDVNRYYHGEIIRHLPHKKPGHIVPVLPELPI